MARKKYQGMTYEEMDALVKKNSGLTAEEQAMLGQLTKQDYDDYAREKNWATSSPTYTGWNGGSVTGNDMMQATYDSIKHDYDVWLDPRNGTRDMIADLLQDVNIRANDDAVKGVGDYDTNRQNYLNKIGWTDYQTVFKNLQETGSLGLKDLEGNDLTEMALAKRKSMLPGEPYEIDPAEMEALQQALAQQAYVNQHLSPLMSGNISGQGGSQGGTWGYDQNTDPVWNAILKQNTRAGEKAMNDALAQLSARTGGLASTYAGQVAQQTMGDYLQNATDYIPQLYDAAYGRWLDEQEMARAAEETAYRRQQDALDRQLAADQTAWERQAYADELAYNREQDALDRQFAQDQFNWEQTKYWNNLNKSGSSASSGMKYDDFVELIEAGYTPTADEMTAYNLNKAKVAAIRNSARNDAEPGYDIDKIIKELNAAASLSEVERIIDGYANAIPSFQAIAPSLFESYARFFEEEEEEVDSSMWNRILGIFR